MDEENPHPLLRLIQETIQHVPMNIFVINNGINEAINNSLNQPPKETPTDENIINSLEQIKMNEELLTQNLSCCICLDKFKLNEMIIKIPCNGQPHLFHMGSDTCQGIKPWLEKNNTCPICRHVLPTKEEEIIEENMEEDGQEEGNMEEEGQEGGIIEEAGQEGGIIDEEEEAGNQHRHVGQIIHNYLMQSHIIDDDGYSEIDMDAAIRLSIEQS